MSLLGHDLFIYDHGHDFGIIHFLVFIIISFYKILVTKCFGPVYNRSRGVCNPVHLPLYDEIALAPCVDVIIVEK